MRGLGACPMNLGFPDRQNTRSTRIGEMRGNRIVGLYSPAGVGRHLQLKPVKAEDEGWN